MYILFIVDFLITLSTTYENLILIFYSKMKIEEFLLL